MGAQHIEFDLSGSIWNHVEGFMLLFCIVDSLLYVFQTIVHFVHLGQKVMLPTAAVRIKSKGCGIHDWMARNIFPQIALNDC
jgi:hypothetical protein